MATESKRAQVRTDVTTLDLILDEIILPYLKEQEDEKDKIQVHIQNL